MATRKCKCCGDVFEQQKPLQFVCSPKCAYEYARKQRIKQDVKTINERVSKWKNEGKSISKLIMEARIPFQKWIRERDRNQPCISCGSAKSQTYHAGHFAKAEIYTGLIFNEDNCHRQCAQCNFYLDGNEANYRIGLIKKIGEKRVKELEDSKDRLRTYKFTREQLTEIKEHYKQLNQKQNGNTNL